MTISFLNPPQDEGVATPLHESPGPGPTPARGRTESIAAVITNFRHGAFLPAAVESVRSQTMPVDRILVVDDASGPAENDVLNALGEHVEVIRLVSRSGPGGARQAGTDASGCSIVAYLDADDLWHPNKVERQYKHLLAAGNVAGSHTGTTVFFADGTEQDFITVKPLELDLRTQLCRNQVAPPTAMLRRTAINAVGGWASGNEIVEDWDLFIRMAKAGFRVVGLRESLTRVRRTGHTHLSSSGLEHIRRLLNTLDRHADLVRAEFGKHGMAQSRRKQLMSHRHKLHRLQRARLAAAAAMAAASLPRATWDWLL